MSKTSQNAGNRVFAERVGRLLRLLRPYDVQP